jgi:hypothetical protein
MGAAIMKPLAVYTKVVLGESYPFKDITKISENAI